MRRGTRSSPNRLTLGSLIGLGGGGRLLPGGGVNSDPITSSSPYQLGESHLPQRRSMRSSRTRTAPAQPAPSGQMDLDAAAASASGLVWDAADSLTSLRRHPSSGSFR